MISQALNGCRGSLGNSPSPPQPPPPLVQSGQLGIEVRAGLHTGEVEILDHDLGGIAVHTGARVVGEAGPGEVLVSSTVKDLVAGSGIEFEDRGMRALKGVPGEWRLYRVLP